MTLLHWGRGREVEVEVGVVGSAVGLQAGVPGYNSGSGKIFHYKLQI